MGREGERLHEPLFSMVPAENFVVALSVPTLSVNGRGLKYMKYLLGIRGKWTSSWELKRADPSQNLLSDLFQTIS